MMTLLHSMQALMVGGIVWAIAIALAILTMYYESLLVSKHNVEYGFDRDRHPVLRMAAVALMSATGLLALFLTFLILERVLRGW